MAVSAGQVYVHDKFYEGEDGKLHPKFLLIVAAPAGDDIVYRLLTSRKRERPFDPRCFHGDPCPGYYLGINLSASLDLHTWLDLRALDDYDPQRFAARCRDKLIRLECTLPGDDLRAILRCTAQAPDTTRRQERHINATIDQLPVA